MTEKVEKLEVLKYVICKLNRIEGKMTLQKIMYFVCETLINRLSLSDLYPYRWWLYGPFSKELYDDLDLLSAFGYVNIEYENQVGIITATNKLREEEIRLSPKVIAEIDRVLEILDILTDNFNSRQLVLFASIHFLRNHTVGIEDKDNLDDICETLRYLKPKFRRDEVEKAMNVVRKIENLTIEKEDLEKLLEKIANLNEKDALELARKIKEGIARRHEVEEVSKDGV